MPDPRFAEATLRKLYRTVVVADKALVTRLSFPFPPL